MFKCIAVVNISGVRKLITLYRLHSNYIYIPRDVFSSLHTQIWMFGTCLQLHWCFTFKLYNFSLVPSYWVQSTTHKNRTGVLKISPETSETSPGTLCNHPNTCTDLFCRLLKPINPENSVLSKYYTNASNNSPDLRVCFYINWNTLKLSVET